MFSVNAFTDGCVLFDFEKQEILYIPQGNLSSEQRAQFGIASTVKGATMTTTDKMDPPLFKVRGRVVKGGVSIEEDLILDTGRDSSFFDDVATPLKTAPLLTNPYRDISGAGATSTYQVDALQVLDAGTPVASHSHTVCEFRSPESKAGASRNTLGIDFLSQFRTLIDFPAKKIYFMPLAHAANVLFPTESARVNGQRLISDAIFQPSATGRWSVLYITDGGGYFATKGLRPGDVLTAIQGKPTDGLLPDEMAAQIVNNIDTLKLTILRDGKEINL